MIKFKSLLVISTITRRSRVFLVINQVNHIKDLKPTKIIFYGDVWPMVHAMSAWTSGQPNKVIMHVT